MMSSSVCYDWQNLTDLIFAEIMMACGQNSLNDLQKCRQVCQNWNVMIYQMTKHKKDTISRKAGSLAAQIKGKSSSTSGSSLLLPEIITAASLAYHGLLDFMDELCVEDVDLASVPAEHLMDLVELADIVHIINVSNYDLISVLANVNCCEELCIDRQILGSEETQELVQAMEYDVERVALGIEGEVRLDITTLTQYSGQGMCGMVECRDDTLNLYRDEVRAWAQRISWEVTEGTNDGQNYINIRNVDIFPSLIYSE